MKSKNIKTIILLIIIYLILAIPFKVLEIIPGFTDIRPVNMLIPVYGIFFGVPGCLILAIGNLFMDAVSGELYMSSIAGLVANFMGPYLVYMYYSKFSKRPFDLSTGKAILKYVGIVFAAALLEAAIITPAVAVMYPEVDANLFALSVITNNFAFPVILGMPIIMVMKNELGFDVKNNGKKVKMEAQKSVMKL